MQKPTLHKDWIDHEGLEIVEDLQQAGFTTYLVGGCVRDLLLGKHPKDFDIATTALPHEIRRVVHHAYIIGKRFRLVLAKRGHKQFEIATFRRNVKVVPGDDEEVPLGDNFYGTPEEDASRRDFTINGLFYDPIKDELIDYNKGVEDLQNGMIRMIGDPFSRMEEDPIRILRGIRLAHMIGFTIDPSLREAMAKHSNKLPATALPRRREEFLKFLRLSEPGLAFFEAHDLGILKNIVPHLDSSFSNGTADEFFNYMQSCADKCPERGDALTAFLCIFLPYVRLEMNLDFNAIHSAIHLLEHPVLQPLMKDELGLYKMEQSLLVRALMMQSTLAKRSHFERKADRRKNVVLLNEAFPVALKTAEVDGLLNGQDLWFWKEHYMKMLPQIEMEKENRKRFKRRRRRNRNGPESFRDESADDSSDATEPASTEP